MFTCQHMKFREFTCSNSRVSLCTGDANRQISEYKFKLSKAEQEIGTMEQNVSGRFVGKFLFDYCVRVHGITFYCCVFQINRLEGQVTRYKASADNSEKIEDELKAEKRKLQREVKSDNSRFIDDQVTGLNISVLLSRSCALL